MKRFLWPAVIVAALILGAEIAYASIPGPDGVIHGCYKTASPAQGALIAIDSSASCPSGYTALNWNQAGPQGPAGTNGVSGYEQVVQNVIVHPGSTWGLHADCPQGKRVVGGGYSADTSKVEIIESHPGVTGIGGGVTVDNWTVSVGYVQTDQSVVDYAICVTAL